MEESLPRIGIDLPAPGERLDPASLFAERPSDIWLEIGFGAGEHLAWQARANPDKGLIGCEVFVNGVAALLAEVAAEGLANVRVFADDARALLDALPDACLGRVFLLFPDPWPKARHAKRRFVQRANLDRLARVMKAGAELRTASDDPQHVAWVLEQTLAHKDFRWLARSADDWLRRPPDWPETRYERKARAEGRPATYLRFVRK